MTPYYAAACWFGYDNNEEVKWTGTNPAGLIWSTIMKDIHKDLPNANFNKPTGLVEKTICKTTGCIATSSCTSTSTEVFTPDNLPETCEGHGVQKICTESGKLATEYCPSTKNQSFGGVIPKEELGLWKPINKASSVGVAKVTETCNIHTKPAETPKPPENTTNTAGNTAGGGNTTGGNAIGGGNNTTGGNSTGGGNNTTGGNAIDGGNNTTGGNSTTGGNTTE